VTLKSTAGKGLRVSDANRPCIDSTGL